MKRFNKYLVGNTPRLSWCALAMLLLIPMQVWADNVSHSYDDLNRLIRTQYENGTVVEYTYDAAGNRTSQKSVAVSVPYNFKGFFPPVDNPPKLNTVKAGSAVPVKFSLSGNQGLNIFAPNYPASQKINCDTAAAIDALTTITSNLNYDASATQYIFVWKTDKAWTNTCRQLAVKLKDGSEHRALFRFTR